MAALWMVLRTFQITRRPSPRLAFLLMGIVLAGATIVMAANSTAKARDNWNRLAASRSAGGPDFVPGAWNEYTPAAVEAARAAGYVVVLDFTAEWCINCKFLKATVLNRDPVQRELHREDVVSFTVDLTPLSAPGWDLLRDLGRTGIPLLVIYAPGSDSPWQSNAYTPQQVLSALEEARAEELARR